MATRRRQDRSDRARASRRSGDRARAPRRVREAPAGAAVGRPAATRGAGAGADPASRRCCCSTSRSARSTPSCARSCSTTWPRCNDEVGITFVYVTHDQEEALTMSDRLAVMDGGHVAQVGTPERGVRATGDRVRRRLPRRRQPARRRVHRRAGRRVALGPHGLVRPACVGRPRPTAPSGSSSGPSGSGC